MKSFTFENQFTRQDALDFYGKEVRIKTVDMGLTNTYCGVLINITADTVQVGEDVVLNECVRGIWEVK